ncbi:high-potential iron-sulfur protein [Rubrivirga sp.]|uniref:high-potential iron-sulfur protein n=1 Tax=Rubrivirga sp. TaxID=1885344 RepID=UPI003B51F92E
MPDSVSRRRFLASAGAVLGVGPVLAACGGGDVTAASCQGYSALDAAALQQRQSLDYVDNTPRPAELCSNCRFYNAPEGGSPCGGCQLFPGPVAPDGWCKSWVIMAT